MKLSRRTFLNAAALGAALAGPITPAWAQPANAAYPAKPITLVMPFPPGGMFDAVMRPLVNDVSQTLGQPVVLMHKPGAGGVTATAGLATMGDADGYTLGIMHNTVIRQPHMTRVSWDPLRDFTYIAGIAGLTTGVVVAADAPWKTLADLIADAKARPGQISWGNVGATSVNRIYGERLARAAGVTFNFIPFKGGSEQFTAVLGHHLDVYGDPGFGAMASSGKLRILATFTENRLKRWPQVPTVKESGYDLVIQSPFGIVAPKNLDAAIAQRLQAAFHKAAQSTDYLRQVADYDLYPWVNDGAAFRAYAQAQSVREKQMLDEVGFKPE
jgi:tripartite-type tricarboxylate transporter receptor subunit TctC